MADVDDDDDELVEEDDTIPPIPVPDPRKLLDPAARAARSLAIRRAIELRTEQERLDRDLNYLENEGDPD